MPNSPDQARRNRRATATSVLTTAIEWYDYYLYGLVSGLVFGHVFFPASSATSGTLQSFAIFAVGFIARPAGAMLFGHFGDRLSRRTALISSTLCMGIPTFAVALVPGYETAGLAGAIILVVLRVVQGIGLGGQWAGAVLVSMETGQAKRRGFFASWAQVGSPLGLILANLAIIATLGVTGSDQFAEWSWRIPFIASAVLIGATLYIRAKVEEPRAEAPKSTANPLLVLLRGHWRQVLLAALTRTSEMAPFYIFTTFVITYGKNFLGLPENRVLNIVLFASVLSLVTIPLFGHLSDRWRRKRVYVVGALLTAVWSLAYFPLLDTGTTALIAVAVTVSLVLHDIQYGPQAALIAESFPPEVRYSGTALGSQLASIISGGPAPIIATALYGWTGSGLAIAGYLVLCSLIGAGAALLLRTGSSSTSAEVPAPVSLRRRS
ncbi:MFS transporter [Sciscionella sediminilitoris]|uniref:MFS transporter n=1 Tax=Sciscionella sediminilitoris TaxID=1445613 RepID=UPI0004DF0BBF|nr:MFS transporter [Sciscionella sp. SE31]